MMRIILTCMLAGLLVSGAEAVPQLKFDDPLGPGGSVTYSGTLGQPLVGTEIPFQSILGLDTPLNAGVTLLCDGCLLGFSTGGVVSEGPTVWTGSSGGTLALVGAIPALGIPAGTTLAEGTFAGPDPRIIGSGDSLAFAGVGIDTKDARLAGFFGLAQEFVFLHTDIALGTATLGADGSFAASVTNADFNNLAVVPGPGALVVLGVGLLLVGWRRRGLDG